MKRCPYCFQEIQDETAKCKYYEEWLVKNKRGVKGCECGRSDARSLEKIGAAAGALTK